MAEIVLIAFNARFSHPSLGSRCLLANLGTMRERARLVEFDLEKRPEEALESILQENPRLVGCGVYVWNTLLVTRFATLLKRVRPSVTLVVGGPEAGAALENHPLAQLADYRIVGEGESAFHDLCQAILAGTPPPRGRIDAAPPNLEKIQLPYANYNDQDLAHRHLYVESSRGCPYRCAFCVSALDHPVRRFPRQPFLEALQELFERGGRHFKFVDRTFNLGKIHATAILDFFLARIDTPGLFVHFELMPDRLTTEIKTRLAAFPAGALQLEAGIQSLEPRVLQAI
ncbi:MAG: cobalamin-dependent protein, partial [Magnetococcales bacterium]|nr:cobalamin-dependent protein [Magnetococcales bacterium]